MYIGLEHKRWLTNCANDKFHVTVSPTCVIDQIPHVVDKAIVIAVEPAQVVEPQLDQHQIRRIVSGDLLDQVLVNCSSTATDGKMVPIIAVRNHNL